MKAHIYKLNSKQFRDLTRFINEVLHRGFSDINHYSGNFGVREFYYKYHAQQLANKLNKTRVGQYYWISINPAEKMLLKAMVSRIDLGLDVENTILRINNLN